MNKKTFRKSYIPTKEDIEAVKELAYKLKGESDAETLNNILEWQEKNIFYWVERGYLARLINGILWGIFILIICLIIKLFYPFSLLMTISFSMIGVAFVCSLLMACILFREYNFKHKLLLTFIIFIIFLIFIKNLELFVLSLLISILLFALLYLVIIYKSIISQ